MTPKMREFYFYLYNSRRLTKASDLLRLYALYKYGGIFMDFDITIKSDFMFTLHYDMTLFVFRSNMSFLAEIFYMSFSKGHPALKLFFDVWEEIDPIGTSAAKIIEGVEIHWRMTFLYVFTIGAFDAAFNVPDKTKLFYSHSEIKQVLTHKKELSWKQGKYGNLQEDPNLFNGQMYNVYIDFLSRPHDIPIHHY